VSGVCFGDNNCVWYNWNLQQDIIAFYRTRNLSSGI